MPIVAVVVGIGFLLASPVSPDNGKPVNADAEVNKGRKTSTPKKEESGGWFDWL